VLYQCFYPEPGPHKKYTRSATLDVMRSKHTWCAPKPGDVFQVHIAKEIITESTVFKKGRFADELTKCIVHHM
jgi:hypothetical protein